MKSGRFKENSFQIGGVEPAKSFVCGEQDLRGNTMFAYTLRVVSAGGNS